MGKYHLVLGSGLVIKGTVILYNSASDGSNPGMSEDLKLNSWEDRGLLIWMESIVTSLKCTCLGNPVGDFHKRFFWQGKMLHRMEAEEHPSGSELIMTVLNHL